ncbi:MAG: putative amidohydrolase [Limisphaerales bacterium]|jgi:predicted amidohydrolase
MTQKFKIAGVQMAVTLADPAANLERMKSLLAGTAVHGAMLTVFPECALTGYCFESKNEALSCAESIPGPATQAIAKTCREHNAFAVFGMLEKDGDDLFNACVLVGPDGFVAKYRKAHLPSLGVDLFTTPGDQPFAVHEINGLRIGMNICYDYSFPEAARVLMLKGADLIVLPTNWPEGSRKGAEYLIHARAHENHLYYLAVDRIGSERGFDFIGLSKCCDPTGDVIAEADHAEEAIIYAEIDPAFARQKNLVKVPGKHEVHRIKDRRPDLYQSS